MKELTIASISFIIFFILLAFKFYDNRRDKYMEQYEQTEIGTIFIRGNTNTDAWGAAQSNPFSQQYKVVEKDRGWFKMQNVKDSTNIVYADAYSVFGENWWSKF